METVAGETVMPDVRADVIAEMTSLISDGFLIFSAWRFDVSTTWPMQKMQCRTHSSAPGGTWTNSRGRRKCPHG